MFNKWFKLFISISIHSIIFVGTIIWQFNLQNQIVYYDVILHTQCQNMLVCFVFYADFNTFFWSSLGGQSTLFTFLDN